ncbi:threonyl-tRNA synthetase [Campylobacter blaseri]|uniref:Threonine--tRNA ligase n=1 Tax=Campylobacter blaseri TaxID=2042961 RepID=A0A2P8R3B5_9BACT|nr:threonine--tRNA ligase [Campylobacter blaseri]PSM52984.1 threonine--tRNA ligase [Campylobacter blaseri]PSM54451.1 threonine--tRNA ligase [Campylobacter blaseri]QKF85305.1 threonyl-tRNA synthetase [Campylobacter blaseri]
MNSDIIAYKLNGEIVDTQSINGREDQATPIYFDNSKDSLEVIRHSCAHLMAEAIISLYPNAKFFVGPAIEDGFYYDFRAFKEDGSKLGEGDLKDIEKKMKELIDSKQNIIKTVSTKKEISEKFKDDDLKQEVLKRIPDGEVSLYTQGSFEDICRGPHVPNTRYLRFFKLTRIAGAYLGGDEKREMLTRIYGVVFADKETLNEHVKMIEEAKKRDHRKLGVEMKLFTFDEQIGAGLPIWLPNGARLRSKLEKFLFPIHRQRGYQPVRGPEILKSDAWKISGHYTNYKENMYFTTIDEQEYGIKPMNCVGHVKVYESDIRSYRDLPLKFFEYGVVHRHEKSGVMHGLFRVREFTQDDAHIFCEPSKIKENILEILDFVDNIMKLFGFNYEMEISTRPEKAIGDDKIWEMATDALKTALDDNNLSYGIDEGGGAFYGPKIDIKIKDSLNRKWQCGTIQVDFNLPERFDLSYIDENNEKQRPVMIHRAILGSFERFIGILIEHTAGELPFFIAPTNVSIIPISDNHYEYAKEIATMLQKLEIDSEILHKNETLNKRIRTAEKTHVPMILVIGDSEVENRSVALRDRRAKQRSEMSLDEFIKFLKEKLNEVHF